MSTTSFDDGPHPDVSPGSMQTLVSRPLPPHPEPITTKRVCFYKSGDPQFTGHRMVINSRTFKTFDALLDALSKKVPLPFGVRTITTPRATHAVRTLDDVQDGGSYICSDQKKVKPFNLDEVHKRQVPWNAARPLSVGRQARRELIRQLSKKNQASTRTVKMAENSLVVRTPKRLTVYKNRDPSIKRVIVLHRRTAPNFEALLDYLSQVMQFPVVKLYTEDGRRVEGLSALILCSGIVVAAGNEPFRIGNYNFQATTKIQSRISEPLNPIQTETLLQEKTTPSWTTSRSRNFSLSSERFLVEQINKSLNGNLNEHHTTKNESMETEGSQPVGSEEMETCDYREDVQERNYPIMPTEDEIEKSFRVNEDGSMTVEMKVHLTIKQEETIQWSTTLSRTSVNNQKRAVCKSKPASGANSVEGTNDSGKESNGPHSLDSKEIYNKSVGFIKEKRENYGSDTSSDKPMPIYRKLPTPAPRQRRKEASVENIKTVSETEVQESTVGAYSYMERTTQGELTEGYCVVSRSSSSSTRTVSKPGKSESAEVKHKNSLSSFRSSGVAEVLQLQNNGTMGITETVVHIYESEGTCDNYYANTQVDVGSKPGYCTKALPQSKPGSPGSTDSGPRSSSNDCDVDLTRQSTSSNSRDGGKNNMLSLSSACSTPPTKMNNNNNNPSILSDGEKQTLFECTSETTQMKMMQDHAGMEPECSDKDIVFNKNNKPKSKKSKESTSSESSGFGKKRKDHALGSSKDLQKTSDALSHTESEKKTSSADSNQHEHKALRSKNTNTKTKTFESSPKSRNLNLNTGNKKLSDKELKLKDKSITDSTQKVHTNDHDQGPKLKKNSLEIQLPAHSAQLIKRLPKQRSMNGVRPKSSKQRQELSESVSLPVLQSASSNVNQYVENWLKKIEPESVPYEDETDHPEIVPRAVFQIGGDSTDVSEIKSDPEKVSVEDEETSLEDNADDRTTPRPPVLIKCEGEPPEPQRAIGFCKSMPILRVPSEQEGLIRMHKSSENLVPPDPSRTSQSTEVSVRSGIKPVFQQLCLSVQSIKRALSQPRLTPVEKEKSSSLPDFSSQVASAFGSPSRALLSFLSMMTLRDGLSVLYKDEPQASNPNVCPEALQVMQSLEKISNIKDEDELRASLTSLQSSTSSKLKQSWRDFQEQNVFGDSPPLSPRLSEQEFAVEVDLEGEMEDHNKQNTFSIEQLLDELNMPEDLHREISSLVEGELKYFNQTDFIKDSENTTEISGKEKDNDDSSLSGSLKKAADMEEEKEHIVNDIISNDITNDPKEPESQELHLIHSHSPDSETTKKDFGNEDSGIAVPNQSPEGNGSDSSKADILETSDNNQMNAENMQENVKFEDLESENKDAEENVSDDRDNMSERADNVTHENIEEQDNYVEEEYTILNMREPSEQSVASELDDTNTKHLRSALETECMPFSDREAAELNEDNQYSPDEDCVREEADNSDFEETISDERIQEQETKPILSDNESLHSQLSDMSLPHHDRTGSKCREQTTESSCQEDDQVMSPDIKNADQQDATPQVLEGEDTDLHSYNSSPQGGSNDENSLTPEAQQTENDLVEEHDIDEVDHESSEACEQVVADTEPDTCTISDPEVVDEDVAEKKSNTSNSEPCEVQTSEIGSLTNKKDSSAEECNAEDCSSVSPEAQQIENDLMEEHDIDEVDHESSEACEQVDADTETNTCTISDPEVVDEDVAEKKSNTSNSEPCDVQTSEIGRLTNKKDSSAEECNAEDCSSVSPEAQQIENDLMEEHDIDEVDHESSEACEQVDADTEPDTCTISDPEVVDEDMAEKKSNTSDSEHCEVQILEEGSLTDKKGSSAEECNAEDCSSVSPEAQQTENDLMEEHDIDEVDHESSEACEQVDADTEPDTCTISDPEVVDEDVEERKSNTSDSEPCEVQILEESSLTNKKGCFAEECNAEDWCSTTAEAQQIENELVEEHDINKVDHESSEACEQVDADTEPDTCTISDPEVVNEDVAEKKSNTSDFEPYEVHNLEKGSLTDKKGSLLASYNNVNGVRHAIVSADTKDSVERESCNSTITSEQQFELAESLGKEHGYHYLLHPTEISQEMLDLINSALLSSTLTVTCDSNGNLRIEPDKRRMREMFTAYQRTDEQYGQKCLPSPNTSDLSDYRPETSDNGGYQSQEFITESGEEEVERLRIFCDIIKQSSEKPTMRNHLKENGSMKLSTWTTTKPTASPSLKSSSLASFQDTKSAIHEPLYHSMSASDKISLDEDSESVHCMALKDKVNSTEGVLIDKGRWLLKENHLIRNSPPVAMGMYGNGDTTSADTAQDNRSEDSHYPFCENQASPLAVISSSELEDMAKPPTPKCTYFNIPHSSDSDPLLDTQSVNSGSCTGDGRRKKELKVFPMGESSKVWAKKNGSMSSFASVEFKLSDGKVHPQEGSGPAANRSHSQESWTIQEEEQREGLSLRCGQHCPIL